MFRGNQHGATVVEDDWARSERIGELRADIHAQELGGPADQFERSLLVPVSLSAVHQQVVHVRWSVVFVFVLFCLFVCLFVCFLDLFILNSGVLVLFHRFCLFVSARFLSFAI